MILDPNPSTNSTEPLDSSAAKPLLSGGATAASAAPQELTLSYLCDALKPSPHAVDPTPSKGKEIAPASPSSSSAGAGAAAGGGAAKWVERDFLQLAADQKRSPPPAPDCEAGIGAKKPRIEPLNLSLSLKPTDPSAPPPRRAYSVSEDYSYSMSVPFSHNPSCSLTMNSTENYESEQLWCGGGEGTNGSVHSRFRPVGDGNGVAFVKDPSIGGVARRPAGSESHSFFPSELPARPPIGNASSKAGGRTATTVAVAPRPDRVLREIVSESVPVMAQILQELPNESVAAIKDFLRSMMEAAPERRDEFVGLQRRLERRSDLTADTLAKCQRTQLDVLVAVRTGVADFLSAKNRLSNAELVEVFLLSRCRNVNCKSVLPVDDCDCKICSTKKGFCSACMCPVCFNFDCASNTCSWVGCDVCSHWCHAACGIQKSLIRPGPSLKGALGTTEMQFHCLGCGHASEMFGFVKEVFTCCAKDWGLQTLMKELDCVRKIFQGSEDFEGKALQGKAEEMLTMLGKKLVSPADACNAMLQFFKYGVADHSVTGGSSKSILTTHASQRGDALPHPSPVTTILPPKPTFNLNPTTSLLDSQIDAPKSNPKLITPDPHFGLPKKEEGGLQSLESIMRFKEAEAKLFQRLADDARREVESYRQIVRAKTEKLEEEYASKLARLCLHETEERRRRKLEELKFLENSQCDYHNMKMRMQAEIASLLERMEATKKQWL